MSKPMINLEEIRTLRYSGNYSLRQLGSDERVSLQINSLFGPPLSWTITELFDVVKERTKYLYKVIPCDESKNVIDLMTTAKELSPNVKPRGILKELVEGHIYQVIDEHGRCLSDQIIFLRRSGNAVTYEKDWPGLQTQELLRAMIDWLIFNRRSPEIVELCRRALWEYEARAYRRKRQELNRDKPEHEVTVFPYDWDHIEEMDIGKDGHIHYLESEVLYYLNFGVCDAEPIPGVDPFSLDKDPVYIRAYQNLKEDMKQ